MLLLSHADFFQNLLFQKILSGTLSECQKGLDPDQDRHTVGPDLVPNCWRCLQRSPEGKELRNKRKRTYSKWHLRVI